MKNGMVIIDADGHAVDNEAVYRERLPEQYRKRNFVALGENAADRQIFKVIKIRRLRMLERSIAQS